MIVSLTLNLATKTAAEIIRVTRGESLTISATIAGAVSGEAYFAWREADRTLRTRLVLQGDGTRRATIAAAAFESWSATAIGSWDIWWIAETGEELALNAVGKIVVTGAVGPDGTDITPVLSEVRIYYGSAAAGLVSPAAIVLALTAQDLAPTGTVAVTCSPDSERAYVAYPAALGTLVWQLDGFEFTTTDTAVALPGASGIAEVYTLRATLHDVLGVSLPYQLEF